MSSHRYPRKQHIRLRRWALRAFLTVAIIGVFAWDTLCIWAIYH